MPKKGQGKGWHRERLRHHYAAKYGKAPPGRSSVPRLSYNAARSLLGPVHTEADHEIRSTFELETLRFDGRFYITIPENLSVSMRTAIVAIDALIGVQPLGLTNLARITRDAIEIARIAVDYSSDPDSGRHLAETLLHAGVCLAMPVAAQAVGYCIAWIEGANCGGFALQIGIARFRSLPEKLWD